MKSSSTPKRSQGDTTADGAENIRQTGVGTQETWGSRSQSAGTRSKAPRRPAQRTSSLAKGRSTATKCRRTCAEPGLRKKTMAGNWDRANTKPSESQPIGDTTQLFRDLTALSDRPVDRTCEPPPTIFACTNARCARHTEATPLRHGLTPRRRERTITDGDVVAVRTKGKIELARYRDIAAHDEIVAVATHAVVALGDT